MLNGQAELVIVGLRDFLARNPGNRFVPPANALLGAALENTGKPAEAGAAYVAAADGADLDYLKAQYLLEAGRAYRDAGKPDEASKVYRRIVDDYPKTSSVIEAQVRLGELTKGQM